MEAEDHLPEAGRRRLRQLRELCPMRCRNLLLSGRSLWIWTACDLDPLLNALVEKPDDHPDVQDERMPYWAELWPAAEFLAETLLTHPPPSHATPWLELGCGPGLPGIVAAGLGFAGVSSDYMPEALWLSELNAMENACADRIRFRQLDWRKTRPQRIYPWILAADVVYETRNFDPLIRCMEDHLAPGGELWLAEPGRSVARDFPVKLAENGWKVSLLRQEQELRVLRIRRSQAD